MNLELLLGPQIQNIFESSDAINVHTDFDFRSNLLKPTCTRSRERVHVHVRCTERVHVRCKFELNCTKYPENRLA